MSAKLHVGRNLSWSTTDETLKSAFSEYGQVIEAVVKTDRDTGRSRGFAFVTFASRPEADAAVSGLHDQEVDGRRIAVHFADRIPGGNGINFGGYH